jgi:hypothetical protein
MVDPLRHLIVDPTKRLVVDLTLIESAICALCANSVQQWQIRPSVLLAGVTHRMGLARRMNFARGMRFMRLKSCRVSGLASGSASAAAITSASVIGRSGSRRLPVLLEVVVLLMPGCSSGSDNPHTIAALGIHHENQRALDHADHGEHLSHRTVSCIDASHSACTDANTGRIIPACARRPLTEGYFRTDEEASKTKQSRIMFHLLLQGILL